jgi:signal peptidase II
MKLSKGKLALIIILTVVIVDQIVKVWVKTHFYLGEDLKITSWFHLLFIENNGMAFGMEIGSKLLLTLVRIIVVGFCLWYIYRLKDRADVKTGFIVCLSLVIAGAAGNIVDCVFYGKIFDNPIPPETATLFPADGAYGSWFHGRVVDMLYFPLFSFYWPDWLPWIGGDRFIFFQPVFNVADAAITVGMLLLILFYSNSFYSVTTADSDKIPDQKAADE